MEVYIRDRWMGHWSQKGVALFLPIVYRAERVKTRQKHSLIERWIGKAKENTHPLPRTNIHLFVLSHLHTTYLSG
jgi:hypothetical protein